MFFRSLDDLTAARATDAGDAAVDGPSPSPDGDAIDAAADGGSDAANDSAPVVSPCIGDAQSFVLCADFDNGNIADGWDGPDNGRVGSVVRSTAHAASAPASLLAQNPALGSGEAELRNALTLEKAGGFTHAVLTFDIYLPTFTMQAGEFGIGVAVLLLRTNDVTTGTVVGVDAKGTYLSIEGAATEYFDVSPLPRDRWAHVVLDFKTSGTFDYSIDGQPGSRSFSAVTLNGPSPRTSISMGVHAFNAPAPAFSAYYDNVTLTLE